MTKPIMVDVLQIAEMADMARQSIYNICTRPDFPLAMEKRGKFNMYLACDVKLWLRDRVDGRKLRRRGRLNAPRRKR